LLDIGKALFRMRQIRETCLGGIFIFQSFNQMGLGELLWLVEGLLLTSLQSLMAWYPDLTVYSPSFDLG
jgi:hypothetical protein